MRITWMPTTVRRRGRRRPRPPRWELDAIGARAQSLIDDLGKAPAGGDEMARLRTEYLERQLSALAARVRMLKGSASSFDEEAKALYDAVAPTNTEAHFQEILAALERRFPGSGPLVSRYDAYRMQFVIPPDQPRQGVPDRHRRLPGAHGGTCPAAGRRAVHGRVRHATSRGAATTGTGRLPQPDSGQHGPADLHRQRDRSRHATKATRATTSTTPCSRRTS